MGTRNLNVGDGVPAGEAAPGDSQWVLYDLWQPSHGRVAAGGATLVSEPAVFYDLSSSGITAKKAGLYEVSCHLLTTLTTDSGYRLAIGIRFYLARAGGGGEWVGGVASSDYMRTNPGHITSDSRLSTYLEMAAGDTVQMFYTRFGITSYQVLAYPGFSQFSLLLLDSPALVMTNAQTTNCNDGSEVPSSYVLSRALPSDGQWNRASWQDTWGARAASGSQTKTYEESERGGTFLLSAQGFTAVESGYCEAASPCRRHTHAL